MQHIENLYQHTAKQEAKEVFSMRLTTEWHLHTEPPCSETTKWDDTVIGD